MSTIESLQLVDEEGRQRFLAVASKPPAIIRGQEYERQGPQGTYIIFNDENGSEKGGIIATSVGAQISVDYANADAIHLGASWVGKDGGASLQLNRMPGPDLPGLEAQDQTTVGATLGCTTTEGSELKLCDSQGRPRIVLKVDANDVPTVRILNEAGEVVSQLP